MTSRSYGSFCRDDEIDPEFNDADEEDDDGEGESERKDTLQTFVFSATLSKDLQRNVKKRSRAPYAGNKKDKSPSTLGE